MLEGYNYTIGQAGRPKAGAIKFVSTMFIVGPLWDASSNWGNILPLASHIEPLYLVEVVLGLAKPNTVGPNPSKLVYV